MIKRIAEKEVHEKEPEGNDNDDENLSDVPL